MCGVYPSLTYDISPRWLAQQIATTPEQSRVFFPPVCTVCHVFFVVVAAGSRRFCLLTLFSLATVMLLSCVRPKKCEYFFLFVPCLVWTLALAEIVFPERFEKHAIFVFASSDLPGDMLRFRTHGFVRLLWLFHCVVT